MNLPTPEEFRDECVAFLDAAVPRRDPANRTSNSIGPIVLFKETDRDREREQVAAARSFRHQLHRAGLAWITGPAEYGGRALPARYESVYAQAAADYQVPDQACFGVGLTMIAQTLLAHGDQTVKGRYLDDLFSGNKIACQLFSEPGAGSDLAGMSTKAIRSGDRWTISGQKVWASGAHFSDIGEIICRTDPDVPKHQGLTAFVVDMHAPGVEVRPLRQMTGGASFNEVFLDNVQVEDHDRIGEVNAGWPVALTTLMHERKSIGAGGVQDALTGVRRRMTELLRQAGLNDDPALRQELMKVHTGFRVAQLTNQRILERMKTGHPGNELSAAKLALANNLTRISEFISKVLGTQLVATLNQSDDLEWAKFVCSTPAVRIFGGTDEIIRNVIAERVLGLPKDS